MKAGFIAALVLLLGACASSPDFAHRESARVTDVPFHPQEKHQCGPAALATVLEFSGVAVSPEDLTREVFLPGRSGSLQVELMAATRRHQRMPVELDGTLGAIHATLQAGQPVLVFQNLGTGWLPLWHFAVVTGYDAESRQFILRSGTDPDKRLSVRHFARSWDLAGNWSVVVLEPGQVIASISDREYLRALHGLESVSAIDNAGEAYRAATRAWPESPLAWVALGNSAYLDNDLPAARSAYSRAIEVKGDSVEAHNNLAGVLLELDCPELALAHVEQAEASLSGDSPYRAAVANSRLEAESAIRNAGTKSECH